MPKALRGAGSHRRYQTQDEAKQDIFEYIEVFYNRQRCHSTIGYQTPQGYEEQNRNVAYFFVLKRLARSQRLLKPEKLLSNVSVNPGQDQLLVLDNVRVIVISWVATILPWSILAVRLLWYE